MKIKILFLLAVCLKISTLPANDCLKYKTVPSLKIKVPSYSISVVQPDRAMDLLHGNVVATVSEEYEIEYGAHRMGDGWCINISAIGVALGYTDFTVQIDKRHKEDSCEYRAILEHEDEHIFAHLSVIEDEMGDIRMAVQSAANNVLPVFAETEDGIDTAMNELQEELENRPEIRLLREKLAAEQEIRNKKIDLNDKGERLRSCSE